MSKLYINYEVSVAGYSNKANAHKIFLMPEKKVTGVSGVKGTIQLMKSNNQEFINANGGDAHFFLVGKKFLGLSNKEQKAFIVNTLIAADMGDEVSNIFGSLATVETAARMNAVLYENAEDVDGMVSDLAYRYFTLSALFDKWTARKVVMAEVHDVMKSGKKVAKSISKILAVQKETKVDLKTTKAENKQSAKELKTEYKADLKGAKAAEKAAKNAQKEAKKSEKNSQDFTDLEAAAAAI